MGEFSISGFSLFAFSGGLRTMSSRSVPTTIIGPKGLLRDSLASLLGGYSYRVTDSRHTAADMPVPPEEESPRMVLLTVRTVDLAVEECANVRRTCQNCKVVAVLENLLDEDFHKLAHSAMDGCIPLDVSQDVLTRTLDLVMWGPARIIVLADEPSLCVSPGEGERKAVSGTGPSGNGLSQRNLSDKTTSAVANPDGPPLVPDVKSDSLSKALADCKPTTSISKENDASSTQRLSRHLTGLGPRTALAPGAGLNGYHADGLEREQSVATARTGDLPTTAAIPALSEREKQIVDGLVKGQANKTIARACGITEATVKVHMKAILRKVPCSNRTQVAIWALAHGDVFRAPMMNGTPAAPNVRMAK
jgi:two-component system nitrate/nitrite response regulator NarL